MSLVEGLATVFTIGMFFANYPLVRSFVKTGTYHNCNQRTGNSSIVPFLSTLLNCCLWFKYGILLGENTIVFVNGVGILVAVLCIYIFCKYTDNVIVINDRR
jgi:solute carrier family 50 (sugar transporter)